MNRYKFVYFPNNSLELHKFIEKHGSSINKIIKSCFDMDFHDNYLWIAQYDAFFMMDSKQVIAFAGTLYKKIVVYQSNVEKYKLIEMDQTESDKFSDDKQTITMGPIIEALCRNSNPEYKGVGNSLLKNICDHYAKDGVAEIYLVPESSKFKAYGYNDCGVVINKDKYLESQVALQQFYNKFGFNEMKNHYDVDVCDGPFGFLPENKLSLVFYPVFNKQLV